MNRLQSFFRARVFEQAHTDRRTGYMVQRNAGIGQMFAVDGISDAIVAEFCKYEIVDLRIQRESGAANADACPVNVERALVIQVGANQFWRDITTIWIWVTVVILVLRLDEAP